MSLENRWDEMVALIPDEMAEAFGTIAPVEELGERLKETCGGVLTTMSLPTDFPLDTREDERRAREIVEILHAAPDRPVAV